MHNALRPKSNIDRLYLLNKGNCRRLLNTEDTISAIQYLKNYAVQIVIGSKTSEMLPMQEKNSKRKGNEEQQNKQMERSGTTWIFIVQSENVVCKECRLWFS